MHHVEEGLQHPLHHRIIFRCVLLQTGRVGVKFDNIWQKF
jgi:hypothetical protein